MTTTRLVRSTFTAAAHPTTAKVAQTAVRALERKRRMLGFLRGDEYSRISNVVGATIGQHLRHSIDHFQRCAACIGDTETAPKAIHYDQRDRGGNLESDPALALAAIDDLQRMLHAASPVSLRRPCRPFFMLSETGSDEHEFSSNLERELFFCVHHGMHHDAMIGIILREWGHEPREGFGLAPSTARYRALS
ncbi:unnamed protein product [Phaeothamnion confervicola]